MEFGLFLNGYIAGPAAHDPELEHRMLMEQIEYGVLADKNNFKYAWLGEHHCLTEYSHMSAPEVVMGAIAARTERDFAGRPNPNFRRSPVKFPFDIEVLPMGRMKRD